MAIRSVELETVEYNLSAIEHVAGRLFYNFAVYAKIDEKADWVSARFEVANTIREQRKKPLVFEASGLMIEFSGFTDPIPLIHGERVIYTARNPRFTFRESEGYIPPRQRNYNQEVTCEIMEEMNIVYHLKKRDYPPTLLFPKEQYATKVEVTPAVQLI